jgi:hypothetical protein
MFVDADKDTLYVYMVGGRTALLPQLDLALTQVLGPERPRESRIEILPAQYSFVDLKSWHDRLSPRVLSLKGAVFTGIDQRNNRIEVGVERLDVAPQVLVIRQQFGIPRDAVTVSVTPPVHLKTQTLAPADESANQQPPVNTLQSKIRPLVGGIQIALRQGNGSLGACTLGFYAVRVSTQEPTPGFVTNSHCTKIEGGVDATTYWQPRPPPDSNGIGIETVDPCYWWWAGGAYPVETPPCESPPHNPPYPLWCPQDHACRLSDSAFVRLQVIAPGGDIKFKNGFIARPTAEDTINWDPPNTFFRIVGERTFLTVGDLVSKVGRSTGWTRGKVTFVCRNTNTGGAYTFICVNQADFDVESGDSGGPVFECLKDGKPVDCDGAPVTDGNIDVNLLGDLFTQQGSFSPIGSARDDTVTGIQNGAHELDTLFRKCGVGRC